MRIVSTEVFYGPNVHARSPLIRLGIELGAFRDRTPASFGDRFMRNLQALLPALVESSRGDGALATPGIGFALLVAEIALDLQRHLGAEVRFCRAESDMRSDPCRVLYALWDDGVACPAAQLALDLLLRLIEAAEKTAAWDAGAERERMLKALRPQALDLITMAIVREAVKRAIPWYRLVPRKPFVQLGQGRRQTHIRESATCHTSSTGRYLSKDKNATNALLARVGIPVPPQRLVNTVEEAIEAARTLGYPVVTKPLDRGNGKGVSVGLSHADAVRWGVGEALRYGDQVIVERFVAGEDHRILVIDGRMVAGAKRIPGHVVGDGERTIAELVELTNADPRRGREYDKVMVKLEFDAQAEQVLTEAGLTPESIPERGRIVPLRRTANVSTGGTCEDVTEIVHPDNRDAAVRAARVLGLNIAGVDFLSTDITRSYREIGGGICEVNFSPGLRPHWNANAARDVVGPIVDTMFPPGSASRIPVAAMMGEGGAADACRLLGHILQCSGGQVGVATARGVEIGGRLAAAGDMTGPDGARTLLFDPSVEAAVIECPAAAILRCGLAIDACDVVVILPRLTEAGTNTQTAERETGRRAAPGRVEEGGGRDQVDASAAAHVLIQTGKTAVVLSADDPAHLDLARGLPAERLVWTRAGEPADAIRAHLDAGGRAVILSRSNRDLELRAGSGAGRSWTLPAGLFEPGSGSADARRAVCAAVAAAWALGVPIDRIQAFLTNAPG